MKTSSRKLLHTLIASRCNRQSPLRSNSEYLSTLTSSMVSWCFFVLRKTFVSTYVRAESVLNPRLNTTLKLHAQLTCLDRLKPAREGVASLSPMASFYKTFHNMNDDIVQAMWEIDDDEYEND